MDEVWRCLISILKFLITVISQQTITAADQQDFMTKLKDKLKHILMGKNSNQPFRDWVKEAWYGEPGLFHRQPRERIGKLIGRQRFPNLII